ncbi:Pyridoxal-dependent decarboxylase conserved domain [Apiospora kogelbergensis]|uniref:Pyridoxal-dependent decarboxylase conserved domain n=1 Tax=Apiospora kogelbergensis TaxID=1337665 RepID=A0AAW0R2S0_9PEZI
MQANGQQAENIDENQIKHALVSSWFLGPRAENIDILQDVFRQALQRQQQTRIALAQGPDEPFFITDAMRNLYIYQDSIFTLQENSRELSEKLADHSVPFWSPRYNAHMNMDTTLASIIGYMSAMIYNPNNVATEASPYTTNVEREVGQQLCEMLGYNHPDKNPAPWGHITCDGSVANLEAIWATRNLKFYPISLKLAIETGPLNFLSTVNPPFRVETCNAGLKEFLSLTKEELLNLTPSTVLSIPILLGERYSISPGFLQDALRPYLIQTTGKDQLEHRLNINPGKYMICATKHYSWPKGGAISGIGSNSFVDIDVDNEARMNMDDLRTKLDKCIRNKTPIFGVVAIMGSTEHGACDPLAEIIQIREEYQKKKGVSFAVHCDAAWGGYFASLLRRRGGREGTPYVPAMPLNPYTKKQLQALKHADSITIDPHKSGYINYPAGGLCYRDGRMRYLLTWTSPIVFHPGDDQGSMGVYGVEGSKPGASAVATWLSHRSLGLHQEGYGRLLGEAIFSCTKLYCHWATMTPRPQDGRSHKVPADALIVVPLIRLPSEIGGEEVEAQKDYIRNNILGRDNRELVEDEQAWDLLCQLGGDLMINAFATNFKIGDKVNQDVGEANYLNQWIFSRLSVSSETDVVSERPLFLTSSEFGEKTYGRCLEVFKLRLGLNTTDEQGDSRPSRGDLRFLVNVTMSPWPTSPNFMSIMVERFREVAEQGVNRCLIRNRRTPDFHGFVVQGWEKVYFTHIAMFNMANHRKQLIITADLPQDVHARYKESRGETPGQFYTIANMEREILEDLLERLSNPDTASQVKFRLDRGIPGGENPSPPVVDGFALSNVRVVVDESMAFAALDVDYPTKMPFYLYGSKGEVHMDHILKTAPNAQISADLVSTDLTDALTDEQLRNGVVVVLDDVFEASLQPLPTTGQEHVVNLNAPGFSLVKEVYHRASVYRTYEEATGGELQPMATGRISIGDTVFADWDDVNMDPAENEDH